ncbi:MAG: hypothetical protein CL674_08350 [Bdellovibrionaceae bacterium]|nr:hypothetical protein [Pseudobdellovibrionaceae bacterium]|tara:strand:+ start:10412 stop:10600 length:189 start_codon:yes stop_codon:yes gene_type:complete
MKKEAESFLHLRASKESLNTFHFESIVNLISKNDSNTQENEKKFKRFSTYASVIEWLGFRKK